MCGGLPLTVSAAACEAEHAYCVHDEEIKSLKLEEYSASTPAAPTASRKSGTISCTADSASIKLTAAKGTTIYYSLNGAKYQKYTAAIKLTKNSTIKAYAQSGSTKSETVTYTYKLTPSVKFNVTDTSSGKNVKLTTKVSGVKLYYTTDGSKPSTSSKLYTSSGISITKTCKLRVLAVKSGWAKANFTKDYTVDSGSSTDTKQLGASGFTTPSAGKATVRYNGSTKTYDASHSAYDAYDGFTVSISSDKYVYFNIAAGAKFNTGDTLTLSNLNGWDKGSGQVVLKGIGLQSASYMFSHVNAEFYDKIELKAVDMDYTGAKPSTIYFYILAHDESGNKMSVEGLVKVNIKDSRHKSGSSTSTGTGSSSSKTSYTSDITGNTFDIPDESRANISYDGTEKTVPANFKKITPTKYTKNDTFLSIYLDGGTGDTSNEYILFMLIADGWKAGTTLELGDLKSDENSVSVRGIYRYYMQSIGEYNESVFTKQNSSYFDDVRFTIIDTDSSGDVLKYYFYVKIHDSSSSHTIEGVVNVREGAEPTPTADVSTGSVTVPTTPGVHGSYACGACKQGKCRPCDGTGKVWGYKQKVQCSVCRGSGICPACKGTGTVVY